MMSRPGTAGVGPRGTRARLKPQPSCLGETARKARYAADLATEPHFADRDHVVGHRLISSRGIKSEAQWEIGRGLTNHETSSRGNEQIFITQIQCGSTVQHSHQQSQSLGVDPDGNAPDVGWRSVDHKGLELDEHGASSLETAEHNRAGHTLPSISQKHRRGIADSLETPLAHGEDSGLVTRPEAVLGSPQQPNRSGALAFERENRINNVLERFRSRNRALFGDVADKDDAGAFRLCVADKGGGAFPNLYEGAGRLVEVRVLECLH